VLTAAGQNHYNRTSTSINSSSISRSVRCMVAALRHANDLLSITTTNAMYSSLVHTLSSSLSCTCTALYTTHKNSDIAVHAHPIKVLHQYRCTASSCTVRYKHSNMHDECNHSAYERGHSSVASHIYRCEGDLPQAPQHAAAAVAALHHQIMCSPLS
jgi:hypothetical protein